MRNSRCRKGSLTSPFPPKSRAQISHEKVTLPVPGREEHFYHRGQRVDTEMNLYKQVFQNNHYFPLISPQVFLVIVPKFTASRPNPFSLVLPYLHNLPFFVKMLCQPSDIPASFGFHFLYMKPFVYTYKY